MDKKIAMMGGICGDIIGSTYEFRPKKSTKIQLLPPRSRFTDDTVMTCAVAEWLMTGDDLVDLMQQWGRRYGNAGYGGMFRRWLGTSNPRPYNSFGNGSGMRVSPVGWYAESLDETLELAEESAVVTHNHPEGIKGAQAVATAIYLAKTDKTKDDIKEYIQKKFGYNLERTCNAIRETYKFDVSCQGSVPESIICFLESNDYESAVRLAVSLGGDADTMADMTGAIAAAFYQNIPDKIMLPCLDLLPDDIYDTVIEFEKYVKGVAIEEK